MSPRRKIYVNGRGCEVEVGGGGGKLNGILMVLKVLVLFIVG